MGWLLKEHFQPAEVAADDREEALEMTRKKLR